MGLKQGNYCPRGILLLLLVLYSWISVSAQSTIACPIRVASEPLDSFIQENANQFNQIPFPLFSSWNNLEEVSDSDDLYTEVSLTANKRTSVFQLKDFNFQIPANAEILGIELRMEGHKEGEGYIRDVDIRLLDNGQAAGINKKEETLGYPWKNGTIEQDKNWRYGSETDLWGLDLTSEKINHENFGVQLQFRNASSNDVIARLDQVVLKVYFLPLYEFCDHDCVTFFVKEMPGPAQYRWTIPQGFELLSHSEFDDAINIGVSYADYGTHEICAEAIIDGLVVEQCCRQFNFTNCEPAIIGDLVWLDKDGNGFFSSGDEGLSGVSVELYDEDANLLSTTISSEEGMYQFSVDPSDNYFLKVIPPNQLIPVFPYQGDINLDSDIDGSNGDLTTPTLEVTGGQILDNIDIGLAAVLSIGDRVFEDVNADGIQDVEDIGLSGINIQLYNASGSQIRSVTSDNEGIYSFNDLPAASYQLTFTAPLDFIPTTQLLNNPDIDSDIDDDGNTDLFVFNQGGIKDSIDAGYFRYGTIGDYIFLDFNGDGLQDSTDIPLQDIKLVLVDINDLVIDSTLSDVNGFYQFDDLRPGFYKVQASVPAEFVPTVFNVESDLGSDAIFVNGIMTTDTIEFKSGDTLSNIDLGFIEMPALIAGYTFQDVNGDGEFFVEDFELSGIVVKLYKSDGTLLHTTQTEDGEYAFENLSPGDYYVEFIRPENLIFTLPYASLSSADSDVDGSQGPGTTAIISLLPGEEKRFIAAGFLYLANIGDYTFLDSNNNGLQDDGPTGIDGVKVWLYNSNFELVDETVSSTSPSEEHGFYTFNDVYPGDYYIVFDTVEMLDFAIENISDLNLNSDVTSTIVFGSTEIITIAANTNYYDIDAGYKYRQGGIQGLAWLDENKNGIQESDESLLSGIGINVFDSGNTLINTLVTDVDGVYTSGGLDAGDYYLIFDFPDTLATTLPNIGSDDSLDSEITGLISESSTDIITVMDGFQVTNINGGFIDAKARICGNVFIDHDGNGMESETEDILSEIVVKLFTIDSTLIDSTMTDLSGDYSFEGILPGEYFVSFTNFPESYFFTTPNEGTDEMLDSDVTGFFDSGSTDSLFVGFLDKLNVDAGVYELTSVGNFAFIDENENGINDLGEAGLDHVMIEILDMDDNVLASTSTAAGGGLDSGFYLIENIPPGIYRTRFTRPLFYIFTDANIGDESTDSDGIPEDDLTAISEPYQVFSNTPNLDVDIGLIFRIPTISSISGITWMDSNSDGIRDVNEMIIGGVTIGLFLEDGSLYDQTSSDSNGEYSFIQLPEGFYFLRFNIPDDKVPTFSNRGIDDSVDSDITGENGPGSTAVFFLAIAEDNSILDAGFAQGLSIGDFVFDDLNGNGIQDSQEFGIENIWVRLFDINGVILDSVLTDIDGTYSFDDIPAATYYLQFDVKDNYCFTDMNIGDDETDSDANDLGYTGLLDLSAGGVVYNIDAGLAEKAVIGNHAFVDINGNGRKNTGEPGLNGVVVYLYDINNNLVATDTTAGNDGDGDAGLYLFENVRFGQYYLVFDYPEGYIFSSPNAGSEEEDSDVTESIVEGSTDLFTINPGDINLDIDAGAFEPGELGDFIWNDLNEDGIQDAGEPGLEGVEVNLFRSSGILVGTTITDVNGAYLFSDLKQGLYFISVEAPEGFTFTLSDVGGDETFDSDVDETGTSPLVSLASGASFTDLDAGLIPINNRLISRVWMDENRDGMRNEMDLPLFDVKVQLTSEDQSFFMETYTSLSGKYSFSDVPEGNYYITVFAPEEMVFTAQDAGGDEMLDSDVNDEGVSGMFSMSPDPSVMNVDAGLMHFVNKLGGVKPLAKDKVQDKTLRKTNTITKIQPNPFYRETVACFLFPLEGNVRIFLTTIDGRRSAFHNFYMMDNRNIYMNLSDVPSGKYILTVVSDHSVVNRWMIKQF